MPRTKSATRQIKRAAMAAAIATLMAVLPRATAQAASEVAVAVARVSTQASPFPRPAAIEPNIDFWIKAFTYWSERDFVVHDRDNVSLAYQKFPMPADAPPPSATVHWPNTYLNPTYT